MENIYDIRVQHFHGNLIVKEFGKSVYICRSYDQKSSVGYCFCISQCISQHTY